VCSVSGPDQVIRWSTAAAVIGVAIGQPRAQRVQAHLGSLI
jgi:hypothetical protein